ncbi:hypothetical protein SUGI_0746190 [Cryptomeria japonica]|nr:hypothetical protein SUGI_0746190 [Cryptomeria japonica]
MRSCLSFPIFWGSFPLCVGWIQPYSLYLGGFCFLRCVGCRCGSYLLSLFGRCYLLRLVFFPASVDQFFWLRHLVWWICDRGSFGAQVCLLGSLSPVVFGGSSCLNLSFPCFGDSTPHDGFVLHTVWMAFALWGVVSGVIGWGFGCVAAFEEDGEYDGEPVSPFCRVFGDMVRSFGRPFVLLMLASVKVFFGDAASFLEVYAGLILVLGKSLAL